MSDEVVVDTARLTEHGLWSEVKVIKRLRAMVDDVLHQLRERHIVASTYGLTRCVAAAITTDYSWRQLQPACTKIIWYNAQPLSSLVATWQQQSVILFVLVGVF